MAKMPINPNGPPNTSEPPIPGTVSFFLASFPSTQSIEKVDRVESVLKTRLPQAELKQLEQTRAERMPEVEVLRRLFSVAGRRCWTVPPKDQGPQQLPLVGSAKALQAQTHEVAEDTKQREAVQHRVQGGGAGERGARGFRQVHVD